jgi:hypothetical protein
MSSRTVLGSRLRSTPLNVELRTLEPKTWNLAGSLTHQRRAWQLPALVSNQIRGHREILLGPAFGVGFG